MPEVPCALVPLNGNAPLPGDGMVYVKAHGTRYGEIQLAASPPLSQCDILCELSETREIETHVRLMLLHDSRIGMVHLESCSVNAFAASAVRLNRSRDLHLDCLEGIVYRLAIPLIKTAHSFQRKRFIYYRINESC